MANGISYFLCVVNLCISVSVLNPSCNADNFFFIFGDSLYDAGNNIYITPNDYLPYYHPPYGTTFFNHSTGRVSDGRLVPDFIATKLNLPFMPPVLDPKANLTNGANFASAGAGVFDVNSNSINLTNQYGNLTAVKANWTAELGPTEANRRLKKAVYLICIGSNDYITYSNQNPNATYGELQDKVNEVIRGIRAVVEKMYTDIGARKFMFQSLGPVDCLPYFKQLFNISGDGCAERPLTLGALHNRALIIMVESIANSDLYPGLIYSVFDFFTALRDRISKPHDYGFEVGSISCCGYGSHHADNCGLFPYCVCRNASTHVYFDGYHNTDATNGQLAEILWSGGAESVSPYNMEKLFEIDNSDVKICSKNSCSA